MIVPFRPNKKESFLGFPPLSTAPPPPLCTYCEGKVLRRYTTVSYRRLFNPDSRFDDPEPIKVEQLSDGLIVDRVRDAVRNEYYWATGLDDAEGNVYWCNVQLDVDTETDYLLTTGNLKFWFVEWTRNAVVTKDGIVFCGVHCLRNFALGAHRAGVRTCVEITPATPESHPYLPPGELSGRYLTDYSFYIQSKPQGDA